MARVFLTGASGFVGTHLLGALVDRGHEVTCVSRSAPTVNGEPAGVEWLRADLHDASTYGGALARANHVIHLAGLLAARRYADYFHTNVEGTRALIDTCMKVAPHLRCFLHMSSIAAMGPADDGSLLNEASPCRPRTTYGESKLAAERLLAETGAKWPIVILRPPFVYGIGDERCAAFLRELSAPGPSTSRLTISTISFCHVSDVVRACLLALEVEHPVDVHTYLIAEPKTYRWPDVDSIIERALRRLAVNGDLACSDPAGRLLVNLHEAKQHSPHGRNGEHWGCDTRKATAELGFRAIRSLDEAAEELIRAYLENGSLFGLGGEAITREA